MMILAVFRSRSQSLDYANRLRAYGVLSETVTAPKDAKIGCGLCVRFDSKVFVRAQAVLKTAKYSSFKGFYKMDFSGATVKLLPYAEKSFL
jgi:hypothetical protein